MDQRNDIMQILHSSNGGPFQTKNNMITVLDEYREKYFENEDLLNTEIMTRTVISKNDK